MTKLKTVYKVTFDLRFGRNWLGAGNPNGFSSRNIASTGDARVAADRVAIEEMRTERGGKTPDAIRILEVVRVAEDVLS